MVTFSKIIGDDYGWVSFGQLSFQSIIKSYDLVLDNLE